MRLTDSPWVGGDCPDSCLAVLLHFPSFSEIVAGGVVEPGTEWDLGGGGWGRGGGGGGVAKGRGLVEAYNVNCSVLTLHFLRLLASFLSVFFKILARNSFICLFVYLCTFFHAKVALGP